MIDCHRSIFYNNLVFAIKESVDSLFRIGVDAQYVQNLSKSNHEYAESLFKHSAFLFEWFYDQQDSRVYQ